MSIKKVITTDFIYTSENSEEEGKQDFLSMKTTIFNCSFDKTSYGSVIISRATNPYDVEIYPSEIKTVIHFKN